jgi:hypothetical protein
MKGGISSSRSMPFLSYFKGHDYFKKSNAFKDFKGSNLIVKKVLYRLKF